jgi:hypothetical protein
MDVAHLPVPVSKSTVAGPEERFLDAIADRLASGQQPAAIAKSIYPNDRVRRRRLRLKIWRMVQNEPGLAERLARRARGQMAVDLVPAVAAAGQRARRGRIDAVRYISEASGFHSAKVQHDHSGEIKIKLEMPRPDYVDADVVEG